MEINERRKKRKTIAHDMCQLRSGTVPEMEEKRGGRKMNFTITYEFLQNYLPNKRCRNTRTRMLVTTADIEVKQVKQDDFPVAFRIHDYGTRSGKYQKVTVPIRTYEGRLYKLWRVESGKDTGNVQTVSDLFGYIEWRSGYEYSCEVEAKFRFDEQQSIVVSDNRQAHIERMQEAADKFLINDAGEVWVETGEPMYHINTFGLGHNHGGTGFFIDTFYNPNCSAENYFTALQYEEACRYFDQVALGRGDTDSVGEWKEKKIDVLMPELVKHNPAADHADGGNSFIDTLEGIADKSRSTNEAALLTIAVTAASIAAEKEA